jgi:uncharacterized protein YjeT (DUF2065 family)
LWLNLALGAVMLVAGILFFVYPQKGMEGTGKLFLLGGYVLVGAFYLGSAYRQIRERRRQAG